MEESKEDGRKFSEIVLCTVTAIMIIFSLVGNSLVCLSFYRNRRLRSITNFYVLSLAIADITFAIFVSPFNVISIGYRRWPFDFNFCQFNGFLSAYWTEDSIFILTMTSINRYVCVVKPRLYAVFFSKRKTVLSILFVFYCHVYLFAHFCNNHSRYIPMGPTRTALSRNILETYSNYKDHFGRSCSSAIAFDCILLR